MNNRLYKTYNSIISSAGGIHLSFYVKNDEKFLERFQEQIEETEIILSACMSPTEKRELMKPIYRLKENLSNQKRSGLFMAIYRNSDYLKVVELPWRCPEICVVSESFHIKPLLAWIQREYQTVLLTVTEGALSLYHVTPRTNKLLSELKISGFNRLRKMSSVDRAEDSFKILKWLRSEFMLLESQKIESVYIDDKVGRLSHLRLWKGDVSDLKITKISNEFKFKFGQVLRAVRRAERSRVRDRFSVRSQLVEKNQTDYLLTSDLNEILKACVENRVLQLKIAYDRNIFGKLDLVTRKIELTYKHVDHEDDDILDDLAQLSIRNGVMPTFVRSSEIIQGKPIVAVIRREPVPEVKEVGEVPHLSVVS